MQAERQKLENQLEDKKISVRGAAEKLLRAYQDEISKGKENSRK
jgi:hypothetical protein